LPPSLATLLQGVNMKKSLMKLERELKKEAKKKGLGEERSDAYVYGTLRKTGWVPSTQKKKK
jgi:hypothetical protein